MDIIKILYQDKSAIEKLKEVLWTVKFLATIFLCRMVMSTVTFKWMFLNSWFLGYDVTSISLFFYFGWIMFITSFGESFANKSKWLRSRRNKFLLLLLFGCILLCYKDVEPEGMATWGVRDNVNKYRPHDCPKNKFMITMLRINEKFSKWTFIDFQSLFKLPDFPVSSTSLFSALARLTWI